MLFPSSRPHRTPTSTTDSLYDSNTSHPSASFTRWSRSPAKSARNGRSTTNSSSRRHYHHPNEPFSDILNYQYSPQEPQPSAIYSTISPRRSLLNNLLP
jgi:hypothetical protein